MATGTFQLRDIEWTVPRWVLVVFALVSAGIHFALATTTGDRVFAVLAIGLLGGFVLYFTELWRPVFYLVGAVYVGTMAVVWLLAGMPFFVLGAVDKALQAALLLLFAYLFVVERRPDAPEGGGP